MEKLLEKIRIKPDEVKLLQKNADRFIILLESRLRKLKISAVPVIGGSFAKGTLIKGDFDCDIFVKFDLKYDSDQLSDLLQKVLDAERVHGSRDYFQVFSHGINFEIVPVLDIKRPKDAKNVTDMSPLHVAWIKKQFSKNPKLSDEVIIAKSFCKAQDCYGAESYIGGFSGHVLDILVVYYGSFAKLIDNATSWNKYKVIDIEGYQTSEDLNKSKISPLIVIDPVDKNRNAAAALTTEKFKKFINSCNKYRKSPGQEFFVRKEITPEIIAQKAGSNTLLLLQIKPIKGKTDVVGGKILKVHTYIQRQLTDFKVLDSDWYWDSKSDALLWYIIDKKQLSAVLEHCGPPLSEKNAVESFKQKYQKTYTKNNRLYTKLARKHRHAKDMVRELLSEKYIAEKVKNISFIRPVGDH